MDRCPKHLKEG